MIYAFEERIGDPSLFCGRREQMALLMNWVNMIPRKMAKSRALLGRRKSGKSAIMQRLFNILWNQNGPVIPFYFEVQEGNQWLLDFSADYYQTFMSQYLSFKTRTVLALDNQPYELAELVKMAIDIGDVHAARNIESFQKYYEAEQVHQSMRWAFGAPSRLAGPQNVFFLVMIDEIQFMTQYIFHDKEHKVSGHNLPGAYHGLVESKVVPMLVSGSYVGWMTQMMRELFKGGRLKQTPISPRLAFDEGLEAVYRYADYNQKEVSDEVALLINQITHSDPYYIATLFRSDWAEQDFTTTQGAIKTLAYEIRNRKGELFGTWSEYIFSTIKAVNDRHTKQILLFLSQERDKECTREQISNAIGNKLSDPKLEERLRTLEYGDLITQGSSNFRYCGIPDDILDFIFRDLYQEEIERKKPNIEEELAAKADWEKEKKSLLGALSELKGRMLELIVYRELNKCRKEGKPIPNLRQRLRPISNPQHLEKIQDMLTAGSKSQFKRVWMNYLLPLPQTTAVELDVFAEGSDADSCWAVVFEIKNRNEKNPPTLNEAQLFMTKVEMVKQWLAQKHIPIKFVCPVYLSAQGFDEKVEMWLHEQGVLTTDSVCWGVSS
jgi:hypothetical protein